MNHRGWLYRAMSIRSCMRASTSALRLSQCRPVACCWFSRAPRSRKRTFRHISSGSYSSSATPLVSGAASIVIPANTLALGTDTLTATYSGDANYLPGVNSETITVNSVPPGLAISGNNLTFLHGATTGNTATTTVTPTGGFQGIVALTASVTSSPAGAQYPPTLSFGPSTPVNITGASAGTALLTITTTAATSAERAFQRLSGGSA